MSEMNMTAEAVDAWRWKEAQKAREPFGVHNTVTELAPVNEYRRLVRENVLPSGGEATSAMLFIEHLAKVSEAVGWQAGVGGCETAGAVISYLAEHPDRFDRFMAGGFLELCPTARMHLEGRLTWTATDGTIWSPAAARAVVEANRAAGGPAT